MSSYRHDWYQYAKQVTITVYAPNVDPATVSADISGPTSQLVTISFADPRATAESDPANATFDRSFELFGPVSAAKINVTKRKVEVSFARESAAEWPALEVSEADQARQRAAAAARTYPTSAKKPSAFTTTASAAATASGAAPSAGAAAAPSDDGEEAGGNFEDFMKTIYAGATEEQKRAMLKSYTESGGTVLSTNWSEVSQGPVAPQPPEGTEPRQF
jgi:suppressor of G2 allele of SKP1|eukprot:gnl/Ergobibamus_cyprinoides/392.p1 GENE.gnl/Ergobibamus_cyprinoides/392~~gnl/Ergobibamus_cyprinoides/392.p1  ORF type:complete len:218 (+),score=45.81 gnl/Ergobibamus_cyprinoides/392:52-705(+)